mgnify:FL=1
MKKIAIVIISLLIANTAFTQSKKEISQQLLESQEKCKKLEGEISDLKLNLSNTTTTLNQISTTNADLLKQLAEQKQQLEKLNKKNDSLLIELNLKKKSEELSSAPKTEEDSIVSIIQSYFACKKWEDRGNYVLNKEAVKPYMKQRYEGNFKTVSILKDDVSIQGSGFKNGDIFKVLVKDMILYLKKIDSYFKIDWMATTGTNETTYAEFQNIGLNQPKEFRVLASIDYDGSSDFPQSTYYNVYFRNIGDGIFGVIPKTSPEGKKIFNLLKDGKQHQLILELVLTSKNKSEFNVTINKVIKDGWSKE